MLWIFQSSCHTEDLSEFQTIIENIGDTFVYEKWSPFEDYHSLYESPCVAFGSLGFIRDFKFGIPGKYCNLKNLECQSYYPHFQKYLINQNFMMLPWGCLRSQKENIYRSIGAADCVFIRPSSGFKHFTGQIIEKERFDKEIGLLGFDQIDSNLLCVISEPVNIVNEYRFFICNDEIVAQSSYRINTELDYYSKVPTHIYWYVKYILHKIKWRPEPMFVIDIGETAGKRLGIIELNSFSCSGFYGINKEEFIIKSRKYILEDYENYV